jgi:hypothetical protein
MMISAGDIAGTGRRDSYPGRGRDARGVVRRDLGRGRSLPPSSLHSTASIRPYPLAVRACGPVPFLSLDRPAARHLAGIVRRCMLRCARPRVLRPAHSIPASPIPPAPSAGLPPGPPAYDDDKPKTRLRYGQPLVIAFNGPVYTPYAPVFC